MYGNDDYYTFISNLRNIICGNKNPYPTINFETVI